MSRSKIDGDELEDTILLKNGDRLRGEIAAFTEAGVTINTKLGESTVALANVTAIIPSPSLLAVRRSPATHAIVILADGSVLTVDTLEWDLAAKEWKATVEEASYSFPEESIVQLQFYSPSTQAIDSVTAVRFRYTPFLPGEEADEALPPMPRRITRELTIDRVAVPRGLSAIGRTEWTFAVPPTATSFRSQIGIPDAIGTSGSARFRVDVDGEQRFESEMITSAMRVASVPVIGCKNAKSITLSIEYGERWDILNQGIWIDPRFVLP